MRAELSGADRGVLGCLARRLKHIGALDRKDALSGCCQPLTSINERHLAHVLTLGHISLSVASEGDVAWESTLGCLDEFERVGNVSLSKTYKHDLMRPLKKELINQKADKNEAKVDFFHTGGTEPLQDIKVKWMK